MFKVLQAIPLACSFDGCVDMSGKRPSTDGEPSVCQKRLMATRRSLPHMTQTALSAFIQYAKEHQVTDLPSSRRSQNRARSATLGETPYGKLVIQVPLTSVPPHANKTMHVINPFAYLHLAMKQGGGFFRLMSQRLASTPSAHDAPWRIVMYSDEVVPGNQLSVHQTRKIWVIYWSFLELHPCLSDEDAWIPMIAESSEGLKTVNGGISQVFAQMIRVFFGLAVHDLMDGGMHIEGPGGFRARLYAVLAMILQDGGAQKLVWSCKGESGTRLCMLCKNLVSTTSTLVDEDGTNLLVCNFLHEHELVFANDADIHATIERLSSFKLTSSAGDFKLRQQAMGFTFQEHALLFAKDLWDRGIVKPAAQFAHDWMHGLFSGGVFNIMVVLFMAKLALVTEVNPWQPLQDYISKWHWPAHLKFDAATAGHFSKQRSKAHKKAGSLKCPASDGLSLLPVLVFYAMTVVKRIPGMEHACNALIALNDVVESLQAAHHGLSTADGLRECVRGMLSAVENAGWRGSCTPKFHWCVHYPATVQKFGLALTCWVHERKHKLVKRYSTDIYNVPALSASVLHEVASHQLHEASLPTCLDHSMQLLNPHPATKKMRGFVRTQFQLEDEAIFASTRARL